MRRMLLATTACAFAACTSFGVGEAFDASPVDGGRVDAAEEPIVLPLDGSHDAGALDASSPCGVLHEICDDFNGETGSPWGVATSGNSFLSYTRTPVGAARFAAERNDAGGFYWIYLFRDLSGAASSMTCDFDVRPEVIADISAPVARIYLFPSSSSPIRNADVNITFGSGATASALYAYPRDGSAANITRFGEIAPLPRGVWTHVKLVVSPAPYTFRVSIGGVESGTLASASNLGELDRMTMQVGIINGTSRERSEVFVDNVACDRTF